jgi:hypothetical protein
MTAPRVRRTIGRLAKLGLITAYCHRLLSLGQLDRIFERFPSLRGA